MSTNFTVAFENHDGSVEGIYGHWDGHIQSAGHTLLNNYNDPQKVHNLVAQGGVSILKETVADSNFYHRDRGEDLNVSYAKDYWDFLESNEQEYNYLWTKEGKWVIAEEDGKLKDLKEEVIKITLKDE